MELLIFFVGFVVLFIVIVVAGSKQRDKRAAELKKEYDEALKGTDKLKALAAGRTYYSHVRIGKLTMSDEQALANDLSTMKQ